MVASDHGAPIIQTQQLCSTQCLSLQCVRYRANQPTSQPASHTHFIRHSVTLALNEATSILLNSKPIWRAQNQIFNSVGHFF